MISTIIGLAAAVIVIFTVTILFVSLLIDPKNTPTKEAKYSPVRVWKNSAGDIRYQPVLRNGDHLYGYHPNLRTMDKGTWLTKHSKMPPNDSALFEDIDTATRIALGEQAKRDKEDWTPLGETR